MRKAIALHGFLGSPSDFDFLCNDFDLFCPQLDLYVREKNTKSLQDDMISFQGGEEAILVGYSFGARLAMGLFLDNPVVYQKLILIGGHAGLKTDESVFERKKVEREFTDALESKDFDDFLNYWNKLSLFEHDHPIAPLKKNMNILKNYFQNYALSMQPFYLPELLLFKDKIQWMFGLKDQKYCNYANQELTEFKVHFLENIGHRVLHNSFAQKAISQEMRND